MPIPKRPALAKRKPKARMYTTSELARSLAVPREHLLALCESGLIDARPNGQGDYIVGEREKERVVREGLPELPASTDREAQPELIAARRPANPALASSVLDAKREEVESLSLELHTERAKRELAKFQREDAEAERQRTEARHAEMLASKRVLAEVRLQQECDSERREREQREAEAKRRQIEFERRWTRWAADRLFNWLTFEQRQAVLRMVEEIINAHGPEDEAIMQRLLVDAIASICAPWEMERRARTKREELVEETVRRLPWDATDGEKVRAATDVRAALSQIPLSAKDWEIRAAVSAAVEPVQKSIEHRRASEEANARAIREAQEAEREKERKAENRRFLKSCRVSEGVSRVDSYLGELYRDGEITVDAYWDSEWRSELKETVRQELDAELTGEEDETREDAERIAEEIVDEELDAKEDEELE